MKKKEIIIALFLSICSICFTTRAKAQSQLYPQFFDLSEITLNAGIFQKAMTVNDSILLEYDVDRLLTPYFRQAGFNDWVTKHPNFDNWGSGTFRLDGHVGGHYLSALALAYAASHDAVMKNKLKERLDYMIHAMDSCQSVFDSNTQGLYGYIGGLPNNSVWTGLYSGSTTNFNNNSGNVPFYVMHKIYAGLRDAWLYTDNETAKKCFLKLCDWGINVIGKLPNSTLQSILNTEHGGMNEVYVDAYQITGDQKYLLAAKRYSHQTMVSGMQTANTTFLDSKHANTQVPKYIGFARLSQEDALSTDKDSIAIYRKAAINFWTDVTTNRTLALGGNSVDEHFLATSSCSGYITNPNGPESCNTNNMLKLTEDLFADTHNAKYADFYEKAMLNHILSTQNPNTGGYVYFTSMRPQHYRIYSQVNEAMWCCVGTGMENHSKYGEFVYAHSTNKDTLFVNLFVASKLNNDKFSLTQSTKFPYEPKTQLTVNKGGTYVMAIRHPEWCKGNYQIVINKDTIKTATRPGTYAYISRTWQPNDTVVVDLPMQLELLPCPNYTNYVAFRYGPVLLAAKTGTSDITDQFAGEGRMDHAPSQGKQYSLTSAPMLIGERNSVLDSIYAANIDSLHFKIKAGLYNNAKFSDLILQPFYTVHEVRYMMYWNQLTESQWNQIKDEVEAEESAAQRLNDRTLDYIATGEQQSDAGHARTGIYETGTYNSEHYIDATKGNWFSYELSTKGVSDSVSLFCRYYSADAGRTMTIYIDGQKFQTVTLGTRSSTGFYNLEYPIATSFLKNTDGSIKDTITVKFVASGSTVTPGIYYIRLLKKYIPFPHYRFVCNRWTVGDAARVKSVSYNKDANTVTVNGNSGTNNIALQLDMNYGDSSYIKLNEKYFLIKGTPLKTTSGSSYLWWLNGANHGTQVVPTYTYSNTSGDSYLIWDITTGGLNDYMKTDSILISANGKSVITVFGLTSSATDYAATIKDIGFYSAQQAVNTYNELSSLFKLTPDAITTIQMDSKNKYKNNMIYTIDGAIVGSADKKSSLPPGIYILNGDKFTLQ